MEKVYRLLLVLLFVSSISFGQEFVKEFQLEKGEAVISNSLYNSIEYLDSRIDTSNYGLVQVGLTNHQAKVIPGVPFSAQLQSYLSSIIDTSAQNGKLLLQIRNLLFAEQTKLFNEKGYCYLRANLFADKTDYYEKITTIDTMIVVKKMDVTNALLKEGGKLITDFVRENLVFERNSGHHYTYEQVYKMDSLEKRDIEIYYTDHFKDGLYYNYTSFKNQIPDKEAEVKIRRDLSIAHVKIPGEHNKMIKLKSNDFYAFVYKGKPYISTGYGYYPLYKGNDKFYFEGDVKPLTTSNDHVMGATVMFGIIGGIIASGSKGAGEKYFTIIEHENGGFIPIKKMPTE